MLGSLPWSKVTISPKPITYVLKFSAFARTRESRHCNRISRSISHFQRTLKTQTVDQKRICIRTSCQNRRFSISIPTLARRASTCDQLCRVKQRHLLGMGVSCPFLAFIRDMYGCNKCPITVGLLQGMYMVQLVLTRSLSPQGRIKKVGDWCDPSRSRKGVDGFANCIQIVQPPICRLH